MKKLSKRLLAVALAGVMATTMAVSASAATKSVVIQQTLKGLEEKPNNTIATECRTNSTSLNRTARDFSTSSSSNANLWRYYSYYYGK